MPKNICLLIISVVTIFVQGCYYDVEEDLYPSTTCDTSGITYGQTVRPVLDQNCMNCHNAIDKMGNIALESYTDVMIVVNSGQLVGAIKHDPTYSAMPQGAAKLDDCTILKIETWVLSGSLKIETMKKVLIIIAIMAALGGGYAFYLYNKPVADTTNIDAAYSISADDLFSQFEEDESSANSKYLGKIIEVNGKVREFSIGDSGDLNLVLASSSDMFGINCGLSKGQEGQYKNYKEGDSIKIKGECSGISMDVVLTRCVIVK